MEFPDHGMQYLGVMQVRKRFRLFIRYVIKLIDYPRTELPQRAYEPTAFWALSYLSSACPNRFKLRDHGNIVILTNITSTKIWFDFFWEKILSDLEVTRSNDSVIFVTNITDLWSLLRVFMLHKPSPVVGSNVYNQSKSLSQPRMFVSIFLCRQFRSLFEIQHACSS